LTVVARTLGESGGRNWAMGEPMLPPGRAQIMRCDGCGGRRRDGQGSECPDCEGTGRQVWRACPRCGDIGYDQVGDGQYACRISCGYRWDETDPRWQIQHLPNPLSESEGGAEIARGVIINCVGLAGTVGGAWPAGSYLAEYDPEDNNGLGRSAWTSDPSRAKVFSLEDAIETYKAVPANRPVRGDGKPNRPLTVFAVEFVSIEEIDQPTITDVIREFDQRQR
jgi:hypothetical protein